LRSRYDAFGNTIAQTQGASNKYGFAGEQFDSSLGDYYLRDRFYDNKIGRFTRQDTYEGIRSQPLTLHKYVYTHNSPIGNIDPSGLSTTDIGNYVETEIKARFWAEDPLYRTRELQVKQIWQRIGITPSSIPFPIVNRRRRDAVPDLIDFRNHYLYEVGTLRERTQKLGKMTDVYLRGINDALTYSGRPANWEGGEEFMPPPIMVIPPGQIVVVLPPAQGVISYQVLNDGYPIATTALAIYTVTQLSLLIAEYVSLSALTRGLAI
jgi:RHS repeat-associated protein